MIEAAEAGGSLKPGGTIIEATAGNTGLGLAQVATLKGYKLILIVPDKMAREKILHLRAMGVDVRLTRSDVGKATRILPGHGPDPGPSRSGIDLRQPVREPGQSAGPTRPRPRPEIFEQMDGDVDAVVVGRRVRRHLTGVGRFMARHSPKTQMVLADPVGSILCEYVATGS